MPLSVILDTFPLARIATVPVPLKFTHARAMYRGALPVGCAKDAVPKVWAPEKVLFDSVCVADVTTKSPAESGRFSVRSLLLFGLAMVNVPVPEGFPDNEIFDNLFLLTEFSAIAS